MFLISCGFLTLEKFRVLILLNDQFRNKSLECKNIIQNLCSFSLRIRFSKLIRILFCSNILSVKIQDMHIKSFMPIVYIQMINSSNINQASPIYSLQQVNIFCTENKHLQISREQKTSQLFEEYVTGDYFEPSYISHISLLHN